MQRLPIAKLNPELSALESRQIKAVVTLIWPYSSSQRHFALLLAEPDFRLRRKKGQVRVRFSGSGARAIATTGVGIGDEVVLSLQGARFIQEGVFSTPGKSLDWELSYSQTVVAQISRDGKQIASLELINVAPTPAPRSPVRRRPVAPSPLQQWASPAFLKRARLSDGPLFEQPAYDPLRDDNDNDHDKKRRRRSYKDWKAWSYNGRMPSPEEEDVDMEEEDPEAFEPTPSRPSRLPKTPTSPLRRVGSPSSRGVPDQSPNESQSEDETQSESDMQSEDELQSEEEEIQSEEEARREEKHAEVARDDAVADLNAEGDTIAEENVEGDTVANTEDLDSPQAIQRNPGNNLSYDGAIDLPPGHNPRQYDFGGDTELDTEDEADAQPEVSSSEVNAESEKEEEGEEEDEEENEEENEEEDEEEDEGGEEEKKGKDTKSNQMRGGFTETVEDNAIGVVEAEEIVSVPAIIKADSQSQTILQAVQQQVVVEDDIPLVVMPPPTLPTLRTEFLTPAMSGMLTPIGKEPTSPTLKPLDSATLPMPSPFPGEHTNTATSYFDNVSINPQLVPLDGPAEDELPNEADYIMENSFYSSISSSRAGNSHPDHHDSVFTPVRFTFGMDGAGFSRTHDPRPLDLSSPPPEETISVNEEPREQLDGRHSMKTDAHEEMVREQKHKDASRSNTGNESSEQIDVGCEDVTESNVEEASEPVVALPPNLGSSTGSANHMARPDSNATAGTVSDYTLGSDENHDSQVVEPSTGEDPAINLEPHVTENRDTQTQEQGGGSFTEASSSALPLETGSPTSWSGARNDESTASVPLEVHEERGTVHGHLEQQTRNTGEDMRSAGTARDSTAPRLDSHSEFLTEDLAHDHDVPQATPQPTTDHGTSQQKHDVSFGSALEFTEITIDEADPFLTMDNSGAWMPHMGFEENSFQNPDGFHIDHYPEVNMESIEDMSMFPATQEDSQGADRRSSPGPGEILIEVPEDRLKVGESQLVSVPDTSPARNTRSQTKPTVSPSKQPISPSQRNTRSTRSKASASTAVPTSLSPSPNRAGSVVSIPDDRMSTSPYNLRSQSRLASSPVAVLKPHTAATPQSLRTYFDPGDVDSFRTSANRVESVNVPVKSYEPSQELGLSQGRYSNVAFVDDSEESQRSEGSLSTVQFSDGIQPYMDNEDAFPYYVSQYLQSSQMQVPPISSPSRRPQPSRLLRASSTPRSVKEASPGVHSTSSQPNTIDGDMQEVASPTPPYQDEEVQRKSSLAPSSAREQTRVGKTEDQQSSSVNNTNAPTPPQAAQRTGSDTRPDFATDMAQQSLATPPITETTSAGFPQPREAADTETASQEKHMEPLPVDKSTPRRNVTATDVASSPPLVHSSDASVSDEEETLITAPTQPSIGLSTPLAYYTPLKDLVYFLNRSSQFHSSSNPDILGLVTSDSTPAARATKGRRDWNTTLHVTDLSLHPATTTVQVFRSYQNALPVAQKGDVVLLRAFGVKSLNRAPMLVSADESSWCVWRFGKPVWGAKKGVWGEMMAREEVNGPEVERGEGEWMEVDRLRKWYDVEVKEAAGDDKAETETNTGDA
jgi:hypothetical protein